jgi:hypothetical protein
MGSEGMGRSGGILLCPLNHFQMTTLTFQFGRRNRKGEELRPSGQLHSPRTSFNARFTSTPAVPERHLEGQESAQPKKQNDPEEGALA